MAISIILQRLIHIHGCPTHRTVEKMFDINIQQQVQFHFDYSTSPTKYTYHIKCTKMNFDETGTGDRYTANHTTITY